MNAQLQPKAFPAHIAKRLAQIKVLIADEDLRIARIVREVLETLGFSTVFMVRDGVEALATLKQEKIDLIITDWNMSPMDGINLIKYLRTSDDSPNRMLPIIMLTGRAEREHVVLARDAGVTEFVVKPFTAKTLCERIALLIEQPRSFIMCKRYVGPDRRRMQHLPPDGHEKRKR